MGDKFHILLPFCVETEFDVFLHVLKRAVSRNPDDNQLTREFVSAMQGKSFDLKMKDLTRSWTPLRSLSQQIRHMKLLGFWTITNFPAFGQKLCGESFQQKPRNDIFVVEDSRFEADKIDEIVSTKMKLRVIECSVNESTFTKLKHFVKVPAIVGVNRDNETRVSRKMVSFDVDEEFVINCWDALKSGTFNMDNEQQDQTVMYSFAATVMDEVQNVQIDVRSDIERISPIPKRICQRRCTGNTGVINPNSSPLQNLESISANNARSELHSVVQNVQIDVRNDIERISPVPERVYQSRCTGNIGVINPNIGQGCRNPLQNLEDISANNARSELHSDVPFQYNYNCRHNDCAMNSEQTDTNIGSLREVIFQIRDEVGTIYKCMQDGESERLCVNERNAEIARMKKSLTELKQANEKLISNQSNLEKQIEDRKSVAVSLKNEMEACLELNVHLKREAGLLAIKLVNFEADAAINVEAKKHLQSETKLITVKLSKALDENSQLQEKYKGDLAISSELNAKLTTENECLRAKLADAEKFIESNHHMKKELGLLKLQNDSIVKELNSEVEQLMKLHSESVGKNEELQCEIAQLKCRSEQSKLNVATRTSDDKTTNTDTSIAFVSISTVENQSVPEFKIDDQAGDDCKELHSNRKSNELKDAVCEAECKSINFKETDYDTEFETDDPIVRECRPKLKKLKFGWMKFSTKKNAQYHPAFVHPPDEDGKCRAQKVTAPGYPASTKNIFFDFNDNLAENEKKSAEKSLLNKFNKNFKFNFN